MKRAMMGILILGVCGMMVAPMGMAGKPGNSGNTSTISGDFFAGPTKGTWPGGDWWLVSARSGPTNTKPGGPITISNVPNGIGNQNNGATIYWSTHGEQFRMVGKGGGQDNINPAKLDQDTYYTSGDVIDHVYFRVTIAGYTYNNHNYGDLWIYTQSQSSNNPITIINGPSTLTISGNNILFNYLESTHDTVPFAQQYHSFIFIIVK